MMPAPLPRNSPAPAEPSTKQVNQPAGGIRIRNVVGVIAVLGALHLAINFIWPEPRIPHGMEGVRKQPDSRIIFENIRGSLELHYYLFGYFLEQGAFPQGFGPGNNSKDVAFSTVYRRLAATPETDDEEALFSIMSQARSYMSTSPSAIDEFPRSERAYRVLRAFGRQYFFERAQWQCPDCTESALKSIAYEQTDAMFSSCLR